MDYFNEIDVKRKKSQNIANNSITEKEFVGKNKKLISIFKKFDKDDNKHLDSNEIDNVLHFMEKAEVENKLSGFKKSTVDSFYKRFDYLFYKKPFINGEISSFYQNNYGDCWALASLKSICGTKAGKKLIKDSISTDNKGNVIVKLKGVNKQYKISQDELLSNNDTVCGDYDVQAIELALYKYDQELLKKYGKDPKRNSSIKTFTGEGGTKQPIYGGFPEVATYILTGQKSSTYYAPDNEATPDTTKDEDAYVGVTPSTGYPDDVTKSNLSFGDVKKYFKNSNLDLSKYAVCISFKKYVNDEIISGHAYSLKSVNKNGTVTIINPWDSDQDIVMKKSELLNNLSSLSIAEIKNSNHFKKNLIADNLINNRKK